MISSENMISRYTGNGTTDTFAYTFRILKDADIKVEIADADDLNGETLTLTTDYTVTGAGDSGGGNVVLTTPLADGWSIAITRDPDMKQETDLGAQESFDAQAIEDSLDKLTMLHQSQQEQLNRCPKVTTTSGDDGDAYLDLIQTHVEAAQLAETNAETAETNAETAQTAAEAAQTAAETAQGLAETAQTGAETAETNAEAAQAAAELAQTAAETAETNAETAETNAETAQTAAEAAQALAETAQTGAETAQGLAETAQTAAEAAQTAAELAQTGAETAETNAAASEAAAAASAAKHIEGTKAEIEALARVAGTLYYATDEGKYYGDDGSKLINIGGGGASSSVEFHAPAGKAPILEEENNRMVHMFGDGLSQELWVDYIVPSTYTAGEDLSLDILAYSPSSSNTWKIKSTAYLLVPGTDAVSSTTNSHASTNSAVTNDQANELAKVTLDLSSSGEINSVAIAAGNVIAIKIERDTGTSDTADIRVLNGSGSIY